MRKKTHGVGHVTKEVFNACHVMRRGGVSVRNIALTTNLSTSTVYKILKCETYEEYREWKKQENAKIFASKKKQKEADRKKAEQLTMPVEPEKKADNVLQEIFQEVIDLLADMAAKEEEAVAVHVNMRDRIYVAETRLRQIFNGGIK